MLAFACVYIIISVCIGKFIEAVAGCTTVSLFVMSVFNTLMLFSMVYDIKLGWCYFDVNCDDADCDFDFDESLKDMNNK